MTDLLREVKLTKFFLGNKMQTVSGSPYSAAKKTMTKEVISHNTLSISKNSSRETEATQEIMQMENQIEILRAKFNTLNGELSQVKMKQEASLQNRKKL